MKYDFIRWPVAVILFLIFCMIMIGTVSAAVVLAGALIVAFVAWEFPFDLSLFLFLLRASYGVAAFITLIFLILDETWSVIKSVADDLRDGTFWRIG